LRSLHFAGQLDLTLSIRKFASQHRGGLTIIITDLFEIADLSETLALLPSPSWDVILLHMLHPQEIEPTIRGDFKMEDIETGEEANYDVDRKALQIYCRRFETWRIQVEGICIDNNTFYTMIPTDWTLAGEIIPHLRSVHVLSAT
jgi:hypothetical protein